MNYFVLDVETPNGKNDSICSLAYVLIDDDKIVKEAEIMVDPRDCFESFNIAVHGITQEMVVGCPTFEDIWGEILSESRGRVFIAHNAQFDLTVLSKALENRKMPPLCVDYLCTVNLAKCIHYNNCNVKGDLVLSTLSRTLGVELIHHHDALCDARACAEIFLRLREMYEFSPKAFVKRFLYPKPKKLPDRNDSKRGMMLTLTPKSN